MQSILLALQSYAFGVKPPLPIYPCFQLFLNPQRDLQYSASFKKVLLGHTAAAAIILGCFLEVL